MAWLLPKHIPLPRDFVGFDPRSSRTRDFHAYRRRLPHWRAPGCCYFMTFRLGDSIPAGVMEKMKAEERRWQVRLNQSASKAGGRLPPEEWAAWRKFQQIQQRKLEALLDKGHGECLLRVPEHQQHLAKAFEHVEGIRCEMLAYAIMPNHAHALFRPLASDSPESLARTWKRHSGDYIHRRLRRSGSLWQEESFDRIIRDADHYARVVRYIAKNPPLAGLTTDQAATWFHPEILSANPAGDP